MTAKTQSEGVTTKQPQLTDVVESEWRLMRISDAGNAQIHAHDLKASGVQSAQNRAQYLGGTTYLPIPGGFIANWTEGGQAMWQAYLQRAQFPEIIAPAVNAMVGIIHKNEWQIELPDGLQFIWEKATDDGQPLEAFSRRITRELLLMGRYEIQVDSPADGGDPYLIGQKAELLINWDTNFYVFNESGMVRKGYEWEEEIRYRVHRLDESGQYEQILVDENGDEIDDSVTPTTTGDRRLDFVPVVVAGARDVTNNIEQPPLIGAADAAVALYRLDADYRHQLYMSGQETLVVDNGSAPEVIGPSVVLEVNSTGDAPANVYYVSPTCSGIAAHKTAIEDEWKNAAKAGAKLFDDGSSIESGEARRMRQNAESATLQTIANSGAAALEKALKYAAVMVGANPDQVVVTPPRNLLDAPMDPAEVLNLVKAYREGGMSWQTLYENLQRGQIASTERDADQELQLMNLDFEDDGESIESPSGMDE